MLLLSVIPRNQYYFELVLDQAVPQLQIDILSQGNQRISPREWFVVPFPILERVVELFISGEIVNYQYDVENEAIIEI